MIHMHNFMAPLLSHECKVVCVKFPNSLHFFYLFIYSVISCEYSGHHDSNFILFCVAATPQCLSSCMLFITDFLCVLGGIIRSPSQITPCSIVNLCLISLQGLSALEQFPHMFFLILNVILLSTGSCLVSTAILPKDKTSVFTQCKNVSSNSHSVLS